MHGKSWKPLLASETPKEPFRTSFFYEYFREAGGKNKGALAVGGFNTPTMTGIRTQSHNLLKYRDHPEWTELFDLTTDPYETKNLVGDPRYAEVNTMLQKRHDILTMRLGYTVPADVPAEPKN